MGDAVVVLRVLAWPSLPDLNPFSALGSVAAGMAADAWTLAMTGLWTAGLWLLRMAFALVDALTTPDVSAEGPLRPALTTTLWLGAAVATLMFFVQLGLLLVRRDGASLGRLLLGVFQFGFVWIAFLGVAGAVVAACSALSRGILQATLHVDMLSAIDWTSSWPRNAVDVTTATVLGITSLLLIIPGAFADILISLVAEAALLVLVVSAPITAAGLLNETTRAWWWKTLRWFTACVLIGPTSSLVFGIGVGISKGVVYGNGDQTVSAIGTAVVGGALVIVGACCPLTLFRLMAFIDPATPSGAALRQSWSDATRAAGVPALSQSGPAPGSSPGPTSAPGGGGSTATASDGAGRAQGEAHAEETTGSRLTSMLGLYGRAVAMTTSFATRATDLSADILGSAGVGAPSYSMTPADERALRSPRGDRGSDAPGGGDGDDSGRGPGPSAPGPGPSGTVPPGPVPPGPVPAGPGPGAGGLTGAGGGGSGSGGGGAGAAGPAADAAGAGAAGGIPPVIVP